MYFDFDSITAAHVLEQRFYNPSSFLVERHVTSGNSDSNLTILLPFYVKKQQEGQIWTALDKCIVIEFDIILVYNLWTFPWLLDFIIL